MFAGAKTGSADLISVKTLCSRRMYVSRPIVLKQLSLRVCFVSLMYPRLICSAIRSTLTATETQLSLRSFSAVAVVTQN
jgi:hypothetical protein